MASDSVMDISMNLNIEDISCLSDNFSMEMSNQTAPAMNVTMDIVPKPTEKHLTLGESTMKSIDTIKLHKASLSSVLTILDSNKSQIETINEKTKCAEVELFDVEKKLAVKKRELNDLVEGLRKLKEDNASLDAQIAVVKKEQKSITKQMDDVKKQKESSEDENLSDKWRVNCYSQLTGVFFGYNPNCPHELKGYASRNGASKNLKTFKFNSKENSSSFVGDYIWNVLEELHENNWHELTQSAS